MLIFRNTGPGMYIKRVNFYFILILMLKAASVWHGLWFAISVYLIWSNESDLYSVAFYIVLSGYVWLVLRFKVSLNLFWRQTNGWMPCNLSLKRRLLYLRQLSGWNMSSYWYVKATADPGGSGGGMEEQAGEKPVHIQQGPEIIWFFFFFFL